MNLILQQFPVVFRALNVGFLQTLKLFFLTLAGAIPLGFLICFGSMSTWTPFYGLSGLFRDEACGPARFLRAFRPVRLLFRLMVWVVRGTPLMLQLLVLYFFPGLVWGRNIWGQGEEGRFAASCAAFIFNYACYFSEIYRGGIQAVPKGQTEAGQALGMTRSQIFLHITLLQMIKHILLPISNEVITLVKDTSLARIIALQELIWAGEAFMKGSHGISGAIWPMFFTGVYYLVFNGVLTAVLGKAEKKLDFFRA